MPYCPKCRLEYESGYTTCSDCMVSLADSLPEICKPDYDKEVFLVSVEDEISAEIIVSHLQSNKIPVLKKYKESGAYLGVYMGMTSFGIDLYVPSRLLNEAKKLLEEMGSLEAPNSKDHGLNGNNESYNKKRTIRAWIILAIFSAGLIFMVAELFITLLTFLVE